MDTRILSIDFMASSKPTFRGLRTVSLMMQSVSHHEENGSVLGLVGRLGKRVSKARTRETSQKTRLAINVDEDTRPGLPVPAG